ncbi:Helicase, C-terminal [Artemisia annua]|uniref:Helicase, C-terminal n=1 Tax=Artemisia annua TaxID=35608 RepID=A0A2U1QMM5_ARTAN|nr:Helicase, C-terminal [Artemisia annua]
METESSEVSSVKRSRSMEKSEESSSLLNPKYTLYSLDKIKRKKVDFGDPFALRNWILEFDRPKYGSVTKDILEILSLRKQIVMPYLARFPSLAAELVEPKATLNDKTIHGTNVRSTNAQVPIIIVDSDDDEPLQPKQHVVLDKQVLEETHESKKKISNPKFKSLARLYGDQNRADNDGQFSLQKFLAGDYSEGEASIVGGDATTAAGKDKSIQDDVETGSDKSVGDDDMEVENDKNRAANDGQVSLQKFSGGDDSEGEASNVGGDTTTAAEPGVGEDKSIQDDDVTVTGSDKSIGDDDVGVENDKSAENDDIFVEKKHNKGVYVGVSEDDMDSDSRSDVNFDGLADIWNEMSVGLESSRDIRPPANENASEDEKECDHSFIFKEDIGYVCRVCGIIQRSIESIIEFQRPKVPKSIRTYHYEGKMNKSDVACDGVTLPGSDFSVSELCAHPRHLRHMKPHQIEGFNFLLRNLVSKNPGGCILAHAPGSGKTFMLISFIQSFMAKYPNARPMVVLPRGILETWKKEFKRWEVEPIKLFDLYSVKGDDVRGSQLEVLKQWVNTRSILFLGYQQFASIVCDTKTDPVPVRCQEILLQQPSLLILDEGHTPRNSDTNILTSLAKVQTPRKVVLSGTLYQNHVKEVFNILNLVRPKFLKMETPKQIKSRILSRVSIEKGFKKSLDNEFYEVVENTLAKDDNPKRKALVIKDLREMTSKVLHYYKGDFLDELPGLVDVSVFLNLSPKQKREILQLKKSNNFKKMSEGSVIYVHPGLKFLKEKSDDGFRGSKEKSDDGFSKFDKMLKNFDEMEGVKAKFFLNMLRLCDSGGEKLLVFGQYLLPLYFLVSLTMKTMGWSVGKQIFMIIGNHVNDERERAMKSFNTSPESRVLFGSIKACSEGISLVGASRIIFMDLPLNPSVTRQAIGRAFRPGQVRKVYAYRLVAAESPEEEDHATSFKKESISKMWFEWNEHCGHHDFEMEKTTVKGCGDPFLEASCFSEDVTAIYKR